MTDRITFSTPLATFSQRLLSALCSLQRERNEIFYVSGGTIRDLFLDRAPADLDIAVRSGAEQCCRDLIEKLGQGTFVPLGIDEEEAARVVYGGTCIDFSSFRKNAATIEEELHHRDFTINAMAMAIEDALHGATEKLIDPMGGYHDIRNRVVRCCPDSFQDDPLRMVRCFRFYAELGFAIHGQTFDNVADHCQAITGMAVERISHELNLIMQSRRAESAMKLMAECGILWHILPEMKKGVGLEQPGFHHEDVFFHNLLALGCVEEVIEAPLSFFGKSGENVENYLRAGKNKRLLRWAAFLHDLGKPSTFSRAAGKEGRITFYNHDRVGRKMFETIADRLRWSRKEKELVGTLIEMHMHPFHLSNVRRQKPLSSKALLKVYKKAGDELPGLFVLAMADSLAGQGKLKPLDMEEELALLFDEVQEAVENRIKPVVTGERLLTGKDLIAHFKLSPGPFFREILGEVELARVEGRVGSRDEAMLFVESYLKSGTVSLVR